MSKTQKQVFDSLVAAGFEPMKKIIEYQNLYELTDRDIQMVLTVINNNLISWVRWLNHLREYKANGHK